MISKPMLSIIVQIVSHLLGKITRSSLKLSYLGKVKHTKLIPTKLVIFKYSVATEKINELRNIVETEYVEKLSRAKKIVI